MIKVSNFAIFFTCVFAVHGLDAPCVADRCVKMPANCVAGPNSATPCQAVLQWNVTEQGTELRLTGRINTNQYVAVGLSKDNKMGQDFVMDCLAGESTTVDSQFSYNVKQGENNNLANQNIAGIKQQGSTRNDGEVMCQWLWSATVTAEGQTFERSSSHVLLAVGPYTKTGTGT